MRGSSAGTVLRDSVVRATAAGTALEVKNGASVGSSKLLNITVHAPSSSALKMKQTDGTAVARNSIFRGDEDVRVFSGSLTVDHSNFDPAASSGYLDGGNNQSAAPVFVDAAAGDFREAGSSPTINAGTGADVALGLADPNGVSRNFGGAPDIGAFEYDGAVQPAVTGDDGSAGGSIGGDSGAVTDTVLPPPAPPQPGKRLGVGHVKGEFESRSRAARAT